MRGAGVVVAASIALSAQTAPPPTPCKPVGRPLFLPAVPEASGIAQAGGALWTHNDSGAPMLFRVDASGRTTAVTVAGAQVRDWEDLAGAPCSTPAQTSARCLYVADIGDNRGSRERVTLYEVPAPAPGSTSTSPAVAVHARYPDYPHDAEALFISKTLGTVIITKEVPPRVYTFAASPKPGEINALTLLTTLNERVRITGAAVSPDERWVALRSNNALFVYTVDDFAKGGNPVRVDLTGFKEPQGEGIAFGAGGELFLVSEGGGGDAAGVFMRIHCAFIR